MTPVGDIDENACLSLQYSSEIEMMDFIDPDVELMMKNDKNVIQK